MKSLQPKTFTYVLIVTIIMLTIGGVMGFYFATKFMSSQKEELRKEKTNLYLSEQRIQQLAELKGKYNKASQKLDEITAAMPSKKQQSEIIVQLKSEAEKIGFDLQNIQFTGSTSTVQKDKSSDPNLTQTTKKGDVYVLPVSLKLKGTFKQLSDYLTIIEKLSRYNSVVTLNIIKASENKETDSQRDMTILLNTYLKP